MSLRPFHLPEDIPVMVDLIPPAFQYPENEEWSIQSDEVESMVDTFKGIRRVWPLIRLGMLLAPPLRDILLGFVWEEDGKAVGLTNVLRQGSTDRWYIGNVAVLPDYRRRGIARKLVEACVQLAKDRGTKSITLDVVHVNVPAYTLYEKLGFEHYAGQAELRLAENDNWPTVPFPNGYTVEDLKLFDWKPRYELAKRITPEAVQHYTPVEEGRFRQPAVMRALAPVLMPALGQKVQAYGVRCGAEVVATASVTLRIRDGGTNHLNATLDPAHATIAPALINLLCRTMQLASPGRQVEWEVMHWQAALLQAALDAGFVKRMDYDTMGIVVQ